MDSADPPVARQISLYAVIQSILSHGPTSRADLAKRTGLSKQTISDVVLELETAGWLKPHGRTMKRLWSAVLGLALSAATPAFADTNLVFAFWGDPPEVPPFQKIATDYMPEYLISAEASAAAIDGKIQVAVWIGKDGM